MDARRFNAALAIAAVAILIFDDPTLVQPSPNGGIPLIAYENIAILILCCSNRTEDD
jgi:hypothetical protein